MLKLGSLVAVIALAHVAHAQPAFGPPSAPEGPPVQQEAQPPEQQPPPQGPPPGSTQATFVSSGADGWDVLLDRRPVCATPCAIWVAPLQFVSLRIHERNPYRVDVGYMPRGSVVVTGEAMSNGEYATGITFTALGGMALVTGITLTAVGCSTERDGMCTAGLITGGVGAVVTAGSIWLIQQSLPRARVVPAIGGTSAGVAGTF